MADFDAQLPIRTTAAESTVSIANVSQVTINPAEDYAQGSTTSGENGVLIQGATTTTAPTYTTATSNPLSLDTSGNLRVTVAGSGLQNVNLTEVGGVAIALGQTTESASIPVTIASNQSPLSVNETQLNGVSLGSPSNYGTSPGAVEVQGVNAFITNTVPVTLASTTITGTVAVTQSTSPWVVSLASTTITGTVTTAGNLTNNNAAPIGDNLGVLSALANAANPSWTEGDQVLLSENLSGHLRTIDSADGPVTPGTVAANSILAGGQYNVTPPTLSTGQQAALQVDVNGRLLVDTNTAASVTPVLTYFTDASVATNATTTHSLAGPVTLDKIDSTASGEMKLTIAIGVTGSEVTYWNGFSSASNQDIEFALPYGYVIPTGSSVKVTLKNRDTQAQDLYVTFFSH